MGEHYPGGNRTEVVSLRFHPQELANARQTAARHGLQLPDLLRRKAQEQPIPAIDRPKPLPPLPVIKSLEAANEIINRLGKILPAIRSLNRDDEAYLLGQLIEIQRHVHAANDALRA